MKRPKPTELDFDLADVRKVKRLMNRALAGLLTIEKRLMKQKKAPKQKGNRDELALNARLQAPEGVWRCPDNADHDEAESFGFPGKCSDCGARMVFVPARKED